MTNDDLKKVAKVTSMTEFIDPKIMDFVLNDLSRRELMVYLRHLKTLINKNSVRIISSKGLLPATKKEITAKFKGKNVEFIVDETIGDGICAQIDDTIINLSTKSYIANTIEGLKNELW